MKRWVSAGGIVIAREADQVWVALLQDRKQRWVLPKGKIEGKETLGACAMREAREELGIGSTPLRIVAKLDVLSFYFRLPNDPEQHFKRVHVYLMETPARVPLHFPSVSPSGREAFSGAGWFSFEQAERMVFRQKRAFLAAKKHIFSKRFRRLGAAKNPAHGE